MKFTTAAACESVVWQMRLADYPRGLNRAKLNELYNGFPPYSTQEEVQNNINTNYNDLSGTKILHDARRQFSTAFNSAEQLFTINLDYGPVWKRREWQNRITREMNKLVRGSRKYLDCLDSVFALNVLHGVGPSMWEDRETWCPYELGVDDVLVPSNTLTSLRNLPMFAVYRQYTGYELWKKIQGPNVDPAWNKPLVKKAIAWVDEQARTLMSASWPEVWSPEKMSERIKQDGGLYASDSIPTIDTFDVYFWNDNGKRSGWNRRIILDAWGSPGVGGAGGSPPASREIARPTKSDKNMLGGRNEFLYNPGDRVYADKLEEIIHFQFADASCVAPFRYHSVRSLGFLLYAVCHVQNRLRCRFNDHVFENLLQYFRVANPADQERLSKVDLVNKGIIPEGLGFVKQEERWQINENVAIQAFDMNRQTMADNSASFTQDFDFDKEKAQETATRTMAKVNATAAMIGSMLNRAYSQQAFQYREIARRFCVKNSKDADVRRFRVECLKAGVPEAALVSERWDVQPVRVIGSGNKMLQVAMADKLMGIRPILDPEAQKMVDRIFVLANSDDPALADQLVPEAKHISESVHDAQATLGTILFGQKVTIESGMNHAEYVEVWLHAMAGIVQRIEQSGGMATPQELVGLNNLAQHIGEHLKILAQDKNAKEQVREYGDDLKNLMNSVKAFAQRLQEQQQKQNGNGKTDPEAQAKIQTMMMAAQTKNQIAADSHAQKTAQRQVQFEQDLKLKAREHKAQLAKTDLEAQASLKHSRMKALSDAENDGKKGKGGKNE